MCFVTLLSRVPVVFPSNKLGGGPVCVAGWGWLAWNALRTMCGHHPKLVPALELTADLPAPHVLDRWRAEQVGGVRGRAADIACGI